MSQPQTIHLKDYQEPDFTIENITLHFDLFENHTTVTNTMKMTKVNPNTNELQLNSVDLELESIQIDGVTLPSEQYQYQDELLTITNLPQQFTLQIQNRIYPQNNTELEGLYKSGGIFCTQNEPEGFRRITPYLDRPDVMTTFTTTIVADRDLYPILLSNGNPQKEHFKILDDNRHTATWHDPHLKPVHLFALVAGNLGSINDSFTTQSGKEIELNIYCDLGNESKCHHAMKSLKEAMIWDEENYGREYDLNIFNIVAVNSFNFGAMENKGLNIFNAQALLADSDTTTDVRFMSIQSIVAHEYFHNWTGNRVGCKNWFQLTLKEGLTVFRDQCFSADLNSAEVQRINDVQLLRERQFVEDASPTSHPIQPQSYISMNNFYTATVYDKGAEVIRMIHTLIGEEAYRKATDLYFETFDGKAVTTEDFLWAMEEASEDKLTQFRRWYHQSGTPTIEVKEHFKENCYTLEFIQQIPKTVKGKEQEPYSFPLIIGLIDSDGKEILEEKLIISKKQESFSFSNLSEKPYLSINRNFSAPILVKYDQAEHPFLMKYDSNSFSRYDATQSFAIETLENIMKNNQINEQFVEAYGYLLDLNLDLSYKALLLKIPCDTTLMQRQKEIDFETIIEAKEKLSKHLAQTHKKKLLELYHKNNHPQSGIDSQSVGERALKNQCLTLLASLDTKEIIQLAQKQYQESLSMSDRIVALQIIEDSAQYHTSTQIESFYEKYKNESLVITQYLSILASSQREGLLQRVIELQKDKVYDIKVPNIVRALIGAFIANNQYFHAKDGSGYQFLSEKLIEIDPINAQLSARLASSFNLYKKMNPINQELIRVELEKIVTTQGISKNLYEITSKILEAN